MNALNYKPVLLKTEQLGKTYRIRRGIFGKQQTIQAVQDVSLSVIEGKTLGLIGESGSGKSTLARCILRLTEPSEGKIIFGKKDITALKQSDFRAYRKKMQIVFQDSGNTFNPRIPVGRMLNEIVRHHSISKNENKNIIPSLMESVGLETNILDRYPHELSGGQRQRLGIARALIVSPSLLICDEPVSALDLSLQAQILNLFKDLQEQNALTYLFISHELPVIRFMADDIAVMYKGYVVERSGKTEWFRNPLHPYSRAFIAFSDKTKSSEQEIHHQQNIHPDNGYHNNGCVYCNHCPLKIKKCLTEMPAEHEVSAGHYVRCHVVCGN